MDFKTDTPETGPNEPKSTDIFALFTSLSLAAIAALRFPGPEYGHCTCFAEITQLASTKRDASKFPRNSSGSSTRNTVEQFYITSLDGKVGQVYPFEEWERIEQKLAALSTFNPTKKKFLDRVNYYGQMVEMDGQGRLLVPATAARLGADQGRSRRDWAILTYLVVRNLEMFRKEIEETSFTPEDEKTLDELGI